MSRHVRDASLETRSARARLRVAHKPYFRLIEPGLHLGFRKLPSGPGTWVMRRYLGDGAYSTENLRTPAGEITIADDFGDADGARTLTFGQAQDRVRERARQLDETGALDPALTVRGAVETHVAAQEQRKADRGERDCRSRMKHVLQDEALAATLLARLTTDDLISWQESALAAMAPGSAQRIVNDLKAALYAAAKRARAQLPSDIRETIRDGLSRTRAGPPAARQFQILPDADVRRLVAAAWELDAADEWGGALARLVLVLAATGARFSQVTRMRVADVQARERRLMVPVSRKGRGGVKNLSHIAVRVGDDVLAALGPATAGRLGSEPLFLRPYRIGERGPWRLAGQFTKPWRAIARRAGLPDTTVAYALRHSSIVRMLRHGLPVRLIAALHDTSSAMIERHYSAHIIDALDELAAGAVIPLSTAPVVPLFGRSKRS
jgi:integrase